MTPASNTSINETVIAPVVAPDASNAIARKSGEENSDNINIKAYAAAKTYLSLTFLRMRSMPKVIIAAIPIETTTTIKVLLNWPDVTLSLFCQEYAVSSAVMNKNPNQLTVTERELFEMRDCRADAVADGSILVNAEKKAVSLL